MDPHVLNYGASPAAGPKLVPGMALAIEPMVTLGHHDTGVLEDGWTVVTADGSCGRPLRAHLRHDRRRAAGC